MRRAVQLIFIIQFILEKGNIILKNTGDPGDTSALSSTFNCYRSGADTMVLGLCPEEILEVKTVA